MNGQEEDDNNNANDFHNHIRCSTLCMMHTAVINKHIDHSAQLMQERIKNYLHVANDQHTAINIIINIFY